MTPLRHSVAIFKYFLAFFVAVSWYVSAFLTYLLPNLSYKLLWISAICWIPLFFFSLGALLGCRWKAIAIFAATWVLVIFPSESFEPVEQFRFWLGVQGFRIHVSPMEDYLSRCRLVTIVEDGQRQQVGKCEDENPSGDAWVSVFYDTAGQFGLPPAQRTQGWKDAMYYNFDSYCYLTEKAVGDRLFAKFYSVVVTLEHVGGC
jgi:hypothetical protein